MRVDQVVQQCKMSLKNHYGARFEALVVYGSVARKQSTPGSDIDLLVLLSSSFSYFDEVRQIIDLLYPIQLESDQLISAKPIPLDDYERGRFQLYRTAKREGVLV